MSSKGLNLRHKLYILELMVESENKIGPRRIKGIKRSQVFLGHIFREILSKRAIALKIYLKGP